MKIAGPKILNRSVGLDSGQFFSFPKSTPVYYIARNSCNEIVPFTSYKIFACAVKPHNNVCPNIK
jgi:hypothetical protein